MNSLNVWMFLLTVIEFATVSNENKYKKTKWKINK